jgi:molecular chaperone DnaJ
MAESQDFYQLLGVERNASDDEIKRSYRQMARRYHPDANPDDPSAGDRFKAINEAYEVLSDPDKRARYDRFGRAGVSGPNGGPQPGQGPGFGGFDDIFDMFFGFGAGGRPRSRPGGPERGPDLEMALEIELVEAAMGLEREIELTRVESCNICGGNGSRPGSRPERCPECHGAGQITVAQNTMFGRIMTSRPCQTCDGRGYIVTDPCPECHGQGMVRRKRKVMITVPAGVPDRSRLRLAGQGQGGLNGGPAGDLYVDIRVKPHPAFTREGLDVVAEAPISYLRAILGGAIEIQTLYGSEVIELPAGTQPGAVFSIRGQGMPDVRSRRRGDHRVVVRVEMPHRLTSRQHELLTELAKESGEPLPDEVVAAGNASSGGTGTASGGGSPQKARKATATKQPKGKRGKKGFFERVKDAVIGDPDE